MFPERAKPDNGIENKMAVDAASLLEEAEAPNPAF